MKAMLTSRDRRIFHSVVQEYIITGEPVSSRKIAKKYSFNLSPATIRNVMAALVDLGYLYQPHTSAGRIPTNIGLKFFVDTFLESKELSPQKKEAIRGKYHKTSWEISGLMKETSKILSEFSHGTGVVLAPKFMDTIFRQIDFVLLRQDQILAIFVSQSGLVQNKIIEMEEGDISQDNLDKYSHYLNEILSGLTLREVRQKILEEIKKEKNIYDILFFSALKLGQSAFGGNQEVEVYVEGQNNLLDYPELATKEKMRALLNAFEEKSILLKILDKAMESQGLQVLIGSENEPQEMEGLSFILSSYSRDRSILGSLGVVGPTRMNYFTIIPIVDYIAKLLSDHLEEM
jgi:heat-inducible transcriptional repressor